MGKLIMHLIKNKELKEEFGVNQVFKEASINEESLTVNSVCLFGRRESANGRTYQDKAIDSISNLSNGCKVFLNHISASEMKDRSGVRDLRDWAGVLEGGFRKGEAVFANLKVRKEYWELVKDIATMKPQGIGHSIDARVKVYQDNNGKECVADVETLRSVDLVSSAATTNNLFEAAIKETKTSDPIFEMFTEGYIKYRVEEKFDELLSTEGMIQNHMDNEKIKYEINDVTYCANDMIRKVLYEDELPIEDKKTKIMAIFTDLDSEIKKRLGKIKTDMEESTLFTLNDVLANKELMEGLMDHFQKQEKFKTLEADLLKVTNDLKEANDKLTAANSLVTEKDKMLEDHKTNVSKLEAKCKELETKLDEIKAAEAIAVKKAMIESMIAEAKLPVEVVTDIFKEDLMGLTDKKDGDKTVTAKEQIATRIEERKTLAGTKKLVVNSGDMRKENKTETKTMTKEQREAAALDLAKKLKR